MPLVTKYKHRKKYP